MKSKNRIIRLTIAFTLLIMMFVTAIVVVIELENNKPEVLIELIK